MVSRFSRLEFHDFRSFLGGPHTVRLDANVVLIHGKNGTGKTNLLSALEFAVTGDIEHLREYEEDYPEVLTCREARAPGWVKLGFVEDGRQKVISRVVGDISPGFDSNARLSYRDRCYLSQTKLSRLLHLYQSTTGRNRDQPLLRFVKELLDLDILDSLAEGLDVAGHVARIRKRVPAFKETEERCELLAREAERRHNDVGKCVDQLAVAKSSLETLLSELGQTPSPPAAVDELAEWAHQQRDLSLARASRLDSHIERIDVIPVDELPPYPEAVSGADSATGIRELASVEATLVGSLNNLSGRLDALEKGPLEHNQRRSEADQEGEHDYERRYRVLGLRISNAYADIESLLARTSHLNNEVRAGRERAAKCTLELEALDDLDASLISALDVFEAALHSVGEHIQGELCPVCDRDYSEVGGGLAQHVVSKLQRLGAEVTELRSRLDERTRLMAKVDEEKRTIAALKKQLQALPDEKELRHQLKDLQDLGEAHTALSPLIEEVATLQQQATDARIRKEATEQWRSRQRRALEIRREAAKDLDLNTEERQYSSNDGHLRNQLKAASANARLHGDQFHAVALAANRVVEADRSLATSMRELESTRRKLDAERAVLERIDILVTEARQVRRAATELQARLLRETFDERLNGLVDDIYSRLVRDEPFHPRIAAETRRGGLSTAIHACIEGKKAFANIGAVVSSANLNTSALSLFLALHLIDTPHFRILAFDDPVQNMDDVHAVQLAALFRTLAYAEVSPRQLMISVHDRALYDYLCLELGPTRKDDLLITVDLARDAHGRVMIEQREHRWEPDKVAFGGGGTA